MEDQQQQAAEQLTIDAQTLRELAEYADGYRDKELALVARASTADKSRSAVRYEIVPVSEIDRDTRIAQGHDTVVLRVSTSSKVKERPVPEVSMTVGGVPIKLPKDCDALFWTESAVEKFLFPYYEGVRIFGPDYLQSLKNVYYGETTGPSIIGFAHVPPSESPPLRDPRKIMESVQVLTPDTGDGTPQAMPVDKFLNLLGAVK